MKHLTSSPEGLDPSTRQEAPVSRDCGSNLGGERDESPAPFLLEPSQALSSLPVVKRSAKPSLLTAEQKAKVRREQNRKAKQRQRGKGDVKVEIMLTPMEWEALKVCRENQLGPLAGFLRRALLTGGKFLANAGTRVGRKVR